MLTTLLTVMLALTACGDDEKDTLSSEETVLTTLNIGYEGGTEIIKATTPQEWKAFPTNNESWITVTPNTGSAGDIELYIQVATNDAFKAREGQVTLKAGMNRQLINIKQEAKPIPPIQCPLEGYSLVWNDEFDKDGTIDAQNGWTYQVAQPGWVNHELQTYVNVASPKGKQVATVKDGILSINCFEEDGKIYSGRVYANASTGWKYGYMEASICLPKGKGTWPAFWMMPVNFRSWPADGEIDIMEEVGYHPNYVSSSLHANSHVHSNNTQVTHEMLCPGAEGEFHTYAIEWTADYIQTYVDGKEQLYYKNRGLGKDDWPYDAPFYLILNLAWGGDWGGATGVDYSALPVSMKVDWVRVWQK